MHKRLIEEGFNRRYVLLPLLLAIAFVVLGYGITETRRAAARAATETLRDRQDVIRLLAETGYSALEAESAQRGYLLTGEPQYLEPMDAGIETTYKKLDELEVLYRALDPPSIQVIDEIRDNLDLKVEEMRQTVALLREDFRRAALDLVKQDLGLRQMAVISAGLESLRARERERILADIEFWNTATRQNTYINTGNLAFTIIALLILGLLATRDIRRRTAYASDLAAQIDARTAELRELGQHMGRVTESEKYALARELHDELGGLLVAMRMDLAQIRKRLGDPVDPDMAARWKRVDEALTQGVELKRRVIEDLRPTLLDNMGLFTALQWLAGQRCEQAQIQLTMRGLDKDIELPPETAIAVFRTVQEAIANVVKHAGATHLDLYASTIGRLTIRIADDGAGLAQGSERKSGSHGLKQMRFRMESVGGDFRIDPNLPRGTAIVLSVPLD